MGCNTLGTASFEEGGSRNPIKLWLIRKLLAKKSDTMDTVLNKFVSKKEAFIKTAMVLFYRFILQIGVLEVFAAILITLRKQKAALSGRNQIYRLQFGVHEMKMKFTAVDLTNMR